MPLQVFECPEHGEFQITLKFSDHVPRFKLCPAMVKYHGLHDKTNNRGCNTQSQCSTHKCNWRSKHIIKPVAGVIVEGGTGGGKDMHLVR